MIREFKQFRILAQLDSTEDTIIYQALNTQTNETAILKCVRIDAENEARMQQLRAEFETTKNCNSPHIVQVLDFEIYQQLMILVKENYPGPSLRTIIQENNISYEEKVLIAIAICDGLQAISDLSVIHQTLCPDNIYWNQSLKQIKLTNFERSFFSSSQQLTATQEQFSAYQIPYISPEQTGRINQKIDYRTDYYSFGLVLYELFTGEPAFTCSDQHELIHHHIAIQPIDPHLKTSTISVFLSKIIMKLLSKNPEERYQSIEGLKYDLEYSINHNNPNIAIASQDRPPSLILSPTLFGRDIDLILFEQCFSDIIYAPIQYVFISGNTGTGKTTLAKTLYPHVQKATGFFFHSQCAQEKQNIPYDSIQQISQAFVDAILSKPEQELEKWKVLIHEAVNPYKQLMLSTLPNLSILVGECDAKPVTNSDSIQHHFSRAFQRLLKYMSQHEPIVFFIDDIQWIDSDSLQLLELISSFDDLSNMLIVCSYRDDNANSLEFLKGFISRVQLSKIKTTSIQINNLSKEETEQFIQASLKQSENISDLSSLCFQKTNGNPFFLHQFLKGLYQNQILSFNHESNHWEWDEYKIQLISPKIDIVATLEEKYFSLPPKTQEILNIAAVLGRKVNIQQLNQLLEINSIELNQLLQSAINNNLISLNKEKSSVSPTFCFIHPRTRKICYQKLPKQNCQEFHLKIVLNFLSNQNIDSLPINTNIHEIINHIFEIEYKNTASNDAQNLIKLLIHTALQAKQSAAFDYAHNCLTLALKLNTHHFGVTQYENTFSLYYELADIEILQSKISSAQERLSFLSTHTKTRNHKLLVLAHKIQISLHFSDHNACIPIIIDGFKLFNIDINQNPSKLHLLFKLAIISFQISRYKPEDILQLNRLSNSEIHALLHLINAGFMSLYFANKTFYALVSLQVITLNLKYGISPIAAFGFFSFIVSYVTLGNYSLPKKYAALVFELASRYDSARYQQILYMLFAAAGRIWYEPIKKAISHIDQAQEQCQAFGEKSFACVGIGNVVGGHFFCGLPLTKILSYIDKNLPYINEAKYIPMAISTNTFKQTIAALQGRTESLTSLTNDDHDEQTLYLEASKTTSQIPYHWFALSKTLLLLIGKQYKEAFEIFKSHSYLVKTSIITFTYPTHLFWGSMAAIEAYQELALKNRIWARLFIWRSIKRLKTISRAMPENTLHRLYCLQAGRARLNKKSHESYNFYQLAIQHAESNEFWHDAALICELVGRNYLKCNQWINGCTLITRAYQHYHRWGASLKCENLAQEFPEYIFQRSKTASDSSRDTDTDSPMFDYSSIIKAALSISSEMNADTIIQKLLHITMENAGAQIVHLLLIDPISNQLVLRATASEQTNEVKILDEPLLAVKMMLPLSIIHYVKRQQQHIAYDDIQHNRQFQSDPYFDQHNTKSLLCLPIRLKNQLIGVMYLENTLTTGVFNADRIELLSILASQTAISIENARLYTNLQTEMEAHKNAKEQEEIANLAKTQFLNTISHELRTPLQTISGVNDLLVKQTKQIPSHPMYQPLTLIQSCADALSTVISDILSVQELDKNATAQASNFILSDLLYSFDSMMKTKIGNKAITFHMNSEIPYSTIIRSDKDRLYQVIQKLLINAAKFTEKGKIILGISLVDSNRIRFQVQDTGIGMNLTALQQIFDCFTQVDQRLTRKHYGLGLGLTICKKNIQILGGEISVQSDVEVGSTFSFWIPFEKVEAKLSLAKNAIDLSSKKILYCDDDAFNLAYLEMILKDKAQYESVDSGKEAISKSNSTLYDLILMDIQMPEMDGTEAMKAIKELDDYKNTPIVALTAQALPGDRERFLNEGFSDYIAKPVKEDELIEKIMSIFSRITD